MCGLSCERGRRPGRLGRPGEARGRRGLSRAPHAAEPGRNAVEESPSPVGGPKALQLRVAGSVECAADERGQLSELRRCLRGEAIGGTWAVIGKSDMQVSPRVKRGTAGGGKGV
jgi:hypothetical protein